MDLLKALTFNSLKQDLLKQRTDLYEYIHRILNRVQLIFFQFNLNFVPYNEI